MIDDKLEKIDRKLDIVLQYKWTVAGAAGVLGTLLSLAISWIAK
jgi:hypothetical protein